MKKALIVRREVAREGKLRRGLGVPSPVVDERLRQGQRVRGRGCRACRRGRPCTRPPLRVSGTSSGVPVIEAENGNRLNPALFQNHPAEACRIRVAGRSRLKTAATFRRCSQALPADQVGVVPVPVVGLQADPHHAGFRVRRQGRREPQPLEDRGTVGWVACKVSESNPAARARPSASASPREIPKRRRVPAMARASTDE